MLTTAQGGLEVDETGSVNVAARKDPLGYVGPGGFVDLTNAADVCIFAVSFATRAKLSLEGGAVRVRDKGTCKFVPKVRPSPFPSRCLGERGALRPAGHASRLCLAVPCCVA